MEKQVRVFILLSCTSNNFANPEYKIYPTWEEALAKFKNMTQEVITSTTVVRRISHDVDERLHFATARLFCNNIGYDLGFYKEVRIESKDIKVVD